MSPGKKAGVKIAGHYRRKCRISQNFLPIPFNPRRYGLQSRPSPAGLPQKNYALVAQMDRVLASEAKGRGFDSRRARHFVAI